jgi:hypothetical protein
MTRTLGASEVARLDKLALEWADDGDPEFAWALRGIADRLDASDDTYDAEAAPLYKDYYTQGYHHGADAWDDVLAWLDGELDKYHLFHFTIGAVVDTADADLEDE